MDEAEKLADMVGIIDNGSIVAEGTPRQLIDQMGSDVISIYGHGDWGQLLEKLQELPFVEAASSSNNIIQVGVDAGNRRLVDVISAAADISFTIEDISLAKPSLDDVFIKHTGRQLRDV
jgi:ABC-2 type transport system ATP-binding protein